MSRAMSKIPLVLIPGLLCDSAAWEYQTKHLADIAIPTVISFHGENTPEKMVQAILKQSPHQFALAGHSMGGWLALEVMRHAPARAIKLCLLNTTASPDSPDKLQRRKQMIQTVEHGKFHELAMQLSDGFILQQRIKKPLQEMFFRSGASRFINDQTAMIQRSESFSILPTIKIPTLIIHALQDQLFSLAEHEEMASLIPNAQLALIEDSGHMSPMEQPQAITTLMRLWLTYF